MNFHYVADEFSLSTHQTFAHVQAREDEVEAKARGVAAVNERLNRKASEVYAKQEQLKHLDAEVATGEASLKAIDSLMLTDAYDWDGRQRALDEDVEATQVKRAESGGVLSMMEMQQKKCDNKRDAACMLCSQAFTDAARAYLDNKCAMMRTNVANSHLIDEELRKKADASRKHKRGHEQALSP